jgi:hypothetical protein
MNVLVVSQGCLQIQSLKARSLIRESGEAESRGSSFRHQDTRRKKHT